MVTTVVDEDGQVLHDCAREGCSLSWDGYVLAPAAYAADVPAPQPPLPADDKAGAPAAGRADPDPDLWAVKGTTATLAPPQQ
jgi:hypothetical protein